MDDLAVFWQLAHDKMATLAIRNASEADSLRKKVLELQGEVALLESSVEDVSEALGDEIVTLKYENKRLKLMLYQMTSLTDWVREGYSSEEYSALVAQFEGREAEGE